MLDHAETHVVLIYAPTYADPNLPDLPAAEANARDFALVLTDRNLVGIPNKNVHLLYATDPVSVVVHLADVAERAKGVLLVYYAGHGLLGPNNKLYLATTITTPRHVMRVIQEGQVDLVRPRLSCGDALLLKIAE